MNPTETHEKNLAWIDERREENRLRGNMFTNWIDPIKESSLSANRKTLERHGPVLQEIDSTDFPNEFVCLVCFEVSEIGICSIDFPCPTYTDITEGLGIPQ